MAQWHGQSLQTGGGLLGLAIEPDNPRPVYISSHYYNMCASETTIMIKPITVARKCLLLQYSI